MKSSILLGRNFLPRPKETEESFSNNDRGLHLPKMSHKIVVSKEEPGISVTIVTLKP